MELRHLRYFVAVAEELSFRKAANRLHVSSPALSKQIKDLEVEIDVKLLDRDTVSVSLTKAGEIFLEDARRLLRDAELAIERATEAQSGHRGKLRIGSVGMIATDFLPRTLKVFRQKYPGVEVAFVEMLPAEQIDAIAAGKIDIGFAYGTEIGKNPSLRSLRVLQSIFGLAVSKHHAFAKRKSVTLRDLRGETMFCLGCDERSSHRGTLLHLFERENLRLTKLRPIQGFDSMLTMIAADQGVSLLPQVLDLANQGITIVPVIANMTELEFHMWAIWQRGAVSHHVQHFVELLEDRVQGARHVA